MMRGVKTTFYLIPSFLSCMMVLMVSRGVRRIELQQPTKELMRMGAMPWGDYWDI